MAHLQYQVVSPGGSNHWNMGRSFAGYSNTLDAASVLQVGWSATVGSLFGRMSVLGSAAVWLE